MTSHKFSPGEVTPEQLEQYRREFEVARANERRAWDAYEAAYHAWCVALRKRGEAESVYVWAQRGMVKVVEVTP